MPAPQGMFGPSAEEVRLALEQQGQQEDIGWANMQPGAGPVRGMAQAGRMFGKGIEALGGYQDPRLAKAKLLEEAKNEVDSSGVSLLDDAKGYYSRAFEALSKRGLTDEAANVYNLMVESDASAADVEYKRAQAGDLKMKALKGRYVQNSKGQVIDSVTGEVIKEGSAAYEAASAQAKVYQDYVNGGFGEVGTPEATARYEEAMNKVNYIRPPDSTKVYLPPLETAAEKAIGGEGAKQLAETFSDTNTNNIESFIDTAATIEDALASSDVITGPGADIRLSLAKLMNIAGADNSEIISKTQILSSRLAKSTLDAIPSSNLGGGQGFTERDKEFLRDASSGTLNWTADSLRYLAYLNKKVARNKLIKINDTLARLPETTKDNLYRAGFNIRPRDIPDIGQPPSWNNTGKSKFNDSVPEGVDPEDWKYMTPEEKALWK